MMKPLKTFLQKGDVLLLILCLLAGSMGLVLVYSATRYNPNLHSDFWKQAAFLVLGIAVYIAVTFVDLEFLLDKWWWVILLLGVGVILLLAPFGVDDDTGNRSWVYFPGLPMGFQPGELAKLSYIALMGWLIHREQPLNRPLSILKLVALTLLMAGSLAYLSGDFGMVLVYLLLLVIMAWVGGLSKWWFVAGGLAGGGAFAALWLFCLPHTALWTDYRVMRLRVVFDHSLAPTGVGWHQSRSVLTIGSGQLTGMGYLQGRQTQSPLSTNLPARHTDFIFSVCGEEFGLVGCVLLLLVLLSIILRCLWVSRRAKSPLSAYIAIGISGMLMVQTVLNVGMCLYVTPVIGLTLPFISYGGSSTLTLFAAMGMVSGIKMRELPSWLQ